jgi:hypothetical protein
MVMRLMQKRLLLRGLFDNYREATSKGSFAELIAKGRTPRVGPAGKGYDAQQVSIERLTY